MTGTWDFFSNVRITEGVKLFGISGVGKTSVCGYEKFLSKHVKMVLINDKPTYVEDIKRQYEELFMNQGVQWFCIMHTSFPHVDRLLNRYYGKFIKRYYCRKATYAMQITFVCKLWKLQYGSLDQVFFCLQCLRYVIFYSLHYYLFLMFDFFVRRK